MSDERAQISQLAFGFNSRGWFRRGAAYLFFVGLPCVTAAGLIGPTPHQRLIGLSLFYLPVALSAAMQKTWPMFAAYGGLIGALIFFASEDAILWAGLYYWPALGMAFLTWLFWFALYSSQKFWEFTDAAAEAVKEAFKKGPASITINDNDGQPPKKGVEWGVNHGDNEDREFPEHHEGLHREEPFGSSVLGKLIVFNKKKP